jgi:diacylglycerol kinase family enzyme
MSSSDSSSPRIGVLLNGNARRVSPRFLPPLQSLLPPEDICYSQSHEEANDFLRQMTTQPYDVLLICGGDGTIQETTSAMHRIFAEEDATERLPAVGVLPLGTGNAISSVVGGSREPARIVRLVQERYDSLERKSFRWVVKDKLLSPFAGIGFDSLLLHCYQQLHKRTKGTIIERLGKGLFGYLVALIFMAIPRQLFTRRPEITVTNEGKGWALDIHGNRVRELEHGEVLFKGRPLLAGISTIPCYGYGVRVFPFVDTGKVMQCRIADLRTLHAVINIPTIWKGTFRHQKIHDFFVEKIKIESDKPVPLQVGGDSVGIHQEMELSLSEETTTLLDLQPLLTLKD